MVRHSGDMVSGDSGQHTIAINLGALPRSVAELYLVMSTWAGATLDQVSGAAARPPCAGLAAACEPVGRFTDALAGCASMVCTQQQSQYCGFAREEHLLGPAS